MVVICACDSLADWAATNGVLALDTSDFQEGAASISNTGTGAVPNTVESEYDPSGTWDWSAEDHLVFWFKTSERSDLKLRVWSGVTAGVDYVEWSRQFLQQVPAINTWCKIKLYKDDFDTSGGAINWAAIKAIRIQLSQTAEWIIYRIDDIRIMPFDPVKAKIGAVAGLDYVSDDILELDIWGDDLKVGRWQMLLKNTDNKYGGRFHTNEASDIEINAVTMMKGYVDDAFPFLDDRGVYTNNLKIMGRDYGRDLARLMYTAAFVDTKGDDLIDAILAAKGSEITYTSPSTAAIVNMERNRTYLIDWLQDVATRTNMNYSAYVDQAKALKFFPVGDENSGVALKSIADALDNNILHLLKGEEIGFSIANVVELSAGSLKDHYSDGNYADYTEGANTTAANEGMTTGAVVANAPTSTVFKTDLVQAIDDWYRGLVIEFTSGALDGERKIISSYVGATKVITVSSAFSEAPGIDDTFVIEGCTNGISSIKFYCTINSFPSIYLDFSGAGLYSHAGLDLSPPDEMSFNIRHNHPGVATLSVRPRLEDAGGNVIEFKRAGGLKGLIGIAQKGKTDVQAPNKWHKIQIPVGESEDNAIQTAEKENKWYYTTEIDEFDWTNVVKIYFKAATATFGAARIWMDNLIIPTVEVISIVEDATSIGIYGRSEWFDQRNDIRNQIELSYAAASELEKRKDPLKNIKVIAMGQTGIKYPGQTVTVQAPKHGLAAATTYRIVSYHHQVRKNPIRGAHSFITTLDLVSDELSPATQFIDPRRYMLNRDPVGTALEILALTRRRVRTSTTTQRQEFGDTHPVSKVFYSGSGAAFPVDAEDGYIFRLTGDIEGYLAAIYEYDVGLVDWIREPMVIHRNADPPAGTEVLYDTLHRTDLDTWYRWSGAAWILIEFAATSVSGELSSTQLKKGIQKFDSNVLVEAIRVIATSAVTFDIDVDDGTGKAEITASAGTPFSDFTAGDELVIQSAENPLHNTTARTVNVVNGGGSSITLDDILASVNNPSDEMMIVSVADGLKWTGDSPAVWFSDGTTQNIANGTVQGLAPATYWVIFTVGGAVSLTSTYSNAVGDTVGIIARVTIVAGREPFIFPVFTRGGSQTLDFLGAGVIDTIMLTGDALIGKILKTSDGVSWTDDAGDPGVIITRDGIKGKGAAGALQALMQSTDGKILGGAGAVILDASGLTIDGQLLFFNDAASNLCGYIYGSDPGGAANLKLYMLSTALRDIYIWAAKKLYLRSDDGGLDAITVVSDTTFNTKGTFITNLRIPLYNGSDPVALANGDIWIRIDE